MTNNERKIKEKAERKRWKKGKGNNDKWKRRKHEQGGERKIWRERETIGSKRVFKKDIK